MRVFVLNFVLALLAIGGVAKERPVVSYDGYKVFRVKTHGRPSLVQEKLSALSYDQWNHDVGHHIDIVVAPDQLAAFEGLQFGPDVQVMHENLGDSIAAESAGTAAVWRRDANDSSWYDAYHNYSDHIQYFQELHDSFPQNSELVSSGTSYQNRSIFGIHLWGADGPGKPVVLYHATVHAREWIAAPVVEYITLQLINGYNGGDNSTQTILDKYDFYIFPFVNPDGFVYSQTTDRLWRKNRQPAPAAAADQSCLGRDINRNWDFAWDANPQGASTNPCSDVYRGEAPSDAPENRGLDALVRQLRDDAGIRLFIDWHSYGQDILSPYGYKETLYAPELAMWTKAANIVSQTIRDGSANGTTFTFGPSGAALYVTTGAAPDHVYSIGGAKFSYTIELPDTGKNGFVLPPESIRPIVEEQWIGQQALLGLLDEVFFDGKGEA